MRRAAPSSSAQAKSATLSLSTSAVLDTAMPAALIASTSMLS